MQAAEASLGRVFVLRLGDGDRVPGCIEEFAAGRGVLRGFCLLLGGAGGGKVVVGPKDGEAAKIEPMVAALAGAHEIAAVGTLFPDGSGKPRLHMHAALGRGDRPLVGCVRQGVDIWKLGEVVLVELHGPMRRAVDPAFGFEVLEVE
ncbi:MAG: PPC domain-containing DNA-binding protein [Thermodesulfobacteriota bacterium]